jgi:hypothetical protein
MSNDLFRQKLFPLKLAMNDAPRIINPEIDHRLIVMILFVFILVRYLLIQNISVNQKRKYTKKSAINSRIKICNDIDVAQPSPTNGNGKPLNKVSGASIGKVYHHFVTDPKEIIVKGKISFHVNCFIPEFSIIV